MDIRKAFVTGRREPSKGIARGSNRRSRYSDLDFESSEATAPKTAAPDMELISILLDNIETSPPGITNRLLLMHHYKQAGWHDAAVDVARGILHLEPSDGEARQLVKSHTRNQSAQSQPVYTNGACERVTERPRHSITQLPPPKTTAERHALERELVEGFERLQARAKTILRETRQVRDMQQEAGATAVRSDNHLQDLKALVDGRISAVVSVRAPLSARAIARVMEADLGRALDVAVADLADFVRWKRASGGPSASDNDAVRDGLARRVRAIVAALPDTPDDLQQHPVTALMHVEHEELERKYINDETMYGDAVTDISRASFWVTEDGYAWDMGELSTALKSNKGVMRNPLSHQMFSTNDVRSILRHPLGQGLGALQMEQSRLSQGVRPSTIDKLERLSGVLLADDSEDQMASRQMIDEFLAYQATLPCSEQQALDELRVPARDSHTGQSFDCTIGEAVRDAQANKVCLHKTGDLIGQAAQYLRQSSTMGRT
ncbi:hypothetical protein DL95DRAFT_326206 [Leptodontidium sp. 2 PMI_412]|nr:hypothetical protein DL95DRAFT_326206 [Leptodontidium sp. 2 PMI_412]